MSKAGIQRASVTSCIVPFAGSNPKRYTFSVRRKARTVQRTEIARIALPDAAGRRSTASAPSAGRKTIQERTSIEESHPMPVLSGHQDEGGRADRSRDPPGDVGLDAAGLEEAREAAPKLGEPGDEVH